YLFGGGISGVLIAGTVFAFVSVVAVISDTDLPGSTSPVSTPPHGTLTIGAGQGIVGEHAGGSSVTALGTALAFAHPPGAVSGPPGLAKKPSGLPPGLAKKPGGLPPGLAKKPSGLPPSLTKKAQRAAWTRAAITGWGSSGSPRPT